MLCKEELRTLLEPYGQEHLIKYWDELDAAGKERLRSDILSIGDIGSLVRCFEQAISERTTLGKKLDSVMKPLDEETKGSYETCDLSELDAYERLGLEAIANGEVAVLLLAGGQGTRLGVSYPKGMYSVHLPSNKTLFQLQAERLRRVQQLAADTCGVACSRGGLPWYIMASEATLDATERFFAEHDYFGIDRRDIVFFEQGTLPCFGHDGRILLESKCKLARAPDGNGGLYRALEQRSLVADMIARGVKYLHVYCVDNVLVRMCDPIFTGFCIAKQANCGSKAVRKLDADEKVGVICQVSGRYQVVEYSEISESTRKLRDDHNNNNDETSNGGGELKYNAGNICTHFLSVDFLAELCR